MNFQVLFVISRQIKQIMKNKYNYALSILSLLFIIIFGNAKAQVISNTFSPEIIIDASSQPYAFDFNGDGVIEFYFLVQDLRLVQCGALPTSVGLLGPKTLTFRRYQQTN